MLKMMSIPTSLFKKDIDDVSLFEEDIEGMTRHEQQCDQFATNMAVDLEVQ